MRRRLRALARRLRGPEGPPPPPPVTDDVLPGPDDFVLYRIIGADLEPRHARGQARENLAFLLAHEPPLPGCEKRWVVNRIADPEEEARVLDLLAAHGQPALRIPFDPAAYARAGWDVSTLPKGYLAGPACAALDAEARERLTLATYRAKNLYAMNNNGARNAALADGRGRAKWVLPWDGNCFVTAAAWAELCAAVAARPDLRYFATPMARVADNADLRDPGFAPEPTEEPQLIFRRDAAERFDEAFPYGRRPKVELFWRLGLGGEWDRWRDDPWDPPRNPRSPEAGRIGRAGWVARLASGRADLERADKTSFLARGAERRAAIRMALDRRDAALPNPHADPAGLVCYATAALDRLAAGAAPALAAALVAEAEAALGRGPYSVVDKTTLPPGGNRHDYWHPAPYWHPNPWIPGGLPYVQRDGVRVPGTRLYEPESDRYDRTRLQRLFDDTTSLALAWRLTGRAAFAERAALLVRTWFVDPATAMTPHLRYAQVRRGRNWNVGTGAGIVELKDLYYVLDAVRLIEAGGALAPAEARGLDAWLGAYLGWLETSPQGARERGARNNHGTYYDLQVAAIAARLGRDETLRDALVRAQARIPAQIAPDGTQPEEMARTTTAHYVFFNLQGWANLLRIGLRTGRLRIDAAQAPWERLARAAGWALGQDLAAWPWRQIEPFDAGRALPFAAHAREIGLLAEAELPPAFRGRDFGAETPRFSPHDGAPPWWALTAGAPAPEAGAESGAESASQSTAESAAKPTAEPAGAA
jgi:hypothetical protein